MNVSLVSLGHLKYPLKVKDLNEWQSQLMTITHKFVVDHLGDPDGNNQEYSDAQLQQILHNNTADFTVGIISSPLEDNYYMRRLSNTTGVISLFQMAEIVRSSNFTLEQYIIRNIYELAVLFEANGGLVPLNDATWAHNATRGCLFDMNIDKYDMVFSLHKPILCTQCTARVQPMQLPVNFIYNLNKELKKIQKPLYYHISDWIKNHPIYALFLTAVSGIFLNIIASYIFEVFKRFLLG